MCDFFPARQHFPQHAVREQDLLAAALVMCFSLAIGEVEHLQGRCYVELDPALSQTSKHQASCTTVKLEESRTITLQSRGTGPGRMSALMNITGMQIRHGGQ